MFTYFKLKLFALFLIMAFFIFFSNNTPGPVFAGTGHNLSGWAWNSAVGWISFNSTDCDSDCNVSPCTSEGFPNGCPPAASTYSNYGVNIDRATGAFSGHAWNNGVGWISFNRSDTGNPPVPDPGGGSGRIAEIDMASGGISGWAKILSMGDDGWIRFNHGRIGFEAEGSFATNELSGWAWNGNNDNTGLGWISFSCENESICGSSNYRVIADLNSPPVVSEVEANNISEDLACGGSALVARLRWKYEDDSGNDATAYRIQVSGGFDTGKCLKSEGVSGDYCTIDFGSGENFSCLENEGYCWYTLNKSVFDSMDYGVEYTWSVTVWDDLDLSTTETGPNFTTYSSEFPDPDDFTWSPREFSVEQEAYFESGERAKYYNGLTEIPCDEDNCSWEWSSPDDNIVFSGGGASASSTILTFKEAKESSIMLEVTDLNTSYSCASTSEMFNIKQKLPSWIETKSPSPY